MIRRVAIPAVLTGLFMVACSPPPTPPVEGETDIVIGTTFPLESNVLDKTRAISVYLPWGYENRNRDFPVLYLVDGGVQQDFHPMSGMAALATLSGQYREFILVGVQTNDRNFELTAPSSVRYDVDRIANNGGAGAFRQFIIDEVKPFIEERYRTSGEDGIIGESLAGLFIVETFLRAPHGFDHFVAISPSLWWREMGLSFEAEALLRTSDFNGKSIYVTIADEGEEMREGTDRLVASIRSVAPEGLRWWYEPMPEESHSTIYNPATLKALRLIFAQAEGG